MADSAPPTVMRQGLLKRNPQMTRQQFSDHWYTKHAALVVPLFLDSGISNYSQLHNPVAVNPALDVSEYDGVASVPSDEALAEMARPKKDGEGDAPWRDQYYREVVLPDERRFLESEALNHIKIVDGGSVVGDTKVVIEDGKVLIDVPDEVWKAWQEYVDRWKK
ncbi:hypothetical protein BP5796_12318 [Coleophoma crateriformis]|uniref:EthD domain-containing protein n=1 Tax=Coleophoma crateriformis TaxID=565419 RepID=A0A3D8Q9U5_9HELO|nr:hypothetical protein BP5796_12318 [Coleophoma crateriformis]